jgi:processive 1,2-diacylglycerol beta-glucosyltransferase
LGFTDKIHELMAEASLLITKPGALTCSEALATGVPLLLYSPLPGQEEDNAAYLVRRGAAVRAANAASLGRIAAWLLSHPEMLNGLRARAAAIGRPDAAADAADVIGGGLLARSVSPAG